MTICSPLFPLPHPSCCSLSPREQACGWVMPPGLYVLHESCASGPAHWLKDLSKSGLMSSAWCTPEHKAQLQSRWGNTSHSIKHRNTNLLYNNKTNSVGLLCGTQCGFENLNRLTQKRCQDRAKHRVVHQGFFLIILTAHTQKGHVKSSNYFI